MYEDMQTGQRRLNARDGDWAVVVGLSIIFSIISKQVVLYSVH